MTDKSPRQNLAKKSVKSLKEKRRDKKAKGNEVSEMERLTTGKGHSKNH
jgi:hypothetical protein